MNRKHLYITVEEKEELKALMKQYGITEQPARLRQKSKPEPRIETTKRGRQRPSRR